MSTRRTLAVGAAIAAVIAIGVGGSAAAGNGDRATVTSADIVDDNVRSNDIKNGGVYSPDINNQSVRQQDIRNGAVGWGELTPFNQARIDRGKVSGLESDGPYPGATDLGDMDGQGDNSEDKWAGDEGAALQSSWVQCPEGKYAIGGGFSRADEGVAAFKNLQIVTSSPTQVEGGQLVYEQIEGDEAGSLQPNGWLVEGFNNGTTELIVRPYVVCVNITD